MTVTPQPSLCQSGPDTSPEVQGVNVRRKPKIGPNGVPFLVGALHQRAECIAGLLPDSPCLVQVLVGVSRQSPAPCVQVEAAVQSKSDSRRLLGWRGDPEGRNPIGKRTDALRSQGHEEASVARTDAERRGARAPIASQVELADLQISADLVRFPRPKRLRSPYERDGPDGSSKHAKDSRERHESFQDPES